MLLEWMDHVGASPARGIPAFQGHWKNAARASGRFLTTSVRSSSSVTRRSAKSARISNAVFAAGKALKKTRYILMSKCVERIGKRTRMPSRRGTGLLRSADFLPRRRAKENQLDPKTGDNRKTVVSPVVGSRTGVIKPPVQLGVDKKYFSERGRKPPVLY